MPSAGAVNVRANKPTAIYVQGKNTCSRDDAQVAMTTEARKVQRSKEGPRGPDRILAKHLTFGAVNLQRCRCRCKGWQPIAAQASASVFRTRAVDALEELVGAHDPDYCRVGVRIEVGP